MLNGSPRKKNTTALIDAHVEGAQENGHEVEVLRVASMDIAGCKGCEYCHTKGEGACIRKDDMSQVIAAYKDADVVVFASPVYYFSMTAQIEAAIQRVYCIGMPPKSGGIPVHVGARCQEKRRSSSRRQTFEKVASPQRSVRARAREKVHGVQCGSYSMRALLLANEWVSFSDE